jgi:predicted nucleotidyltransferase
MSMPSGSADASPVISSGEPWLEHVVDAIAALPATRAVALGGSRATGEAGAESDWDLAVYYRGAAPELEALGLPGTYAAPGSWGPIVNGGAWLRVDDRRVDLLLRDLDRIEAWAADAREGRFQVLRQAGYLAGAPTYLPVGELALGRPLRGELPRVDGFPAALREPARRRWQGEARTALLFAELHAGRGSTTACAGMLAHAALAAAHAELARRGEWVLNEKGLLRRAGLEAADLIVADLGARSLELAVAEVGALVGLEPLELP